MHCSSARLEMDLYRRTHFIPFKPFWKLVLLARSLLSAVTVLVYPVQAGKLHLTLVHAHGDLIRDIGEQARRSLDAIANCLDKNAPIQPGLDSLVALHRGMAELVRALQTLPPELALEAESMAFHIMAINLLTATSQVGPVFCVREQARICVQSDLHTEYIPRSTVYS